MTQAVTELVVRGDGALAVLNQFEDAMERSGVATEHSTGAIADFERRMATARAEIDRGNAITTQSIARKTAEQRAWERWSSTVDRAQGLRIRLEREAAQASVAAANAVNLGYATQEQALATLISLEQRHAAQMQAVTDQAQNQAKSTTVAAAANDNYARSVHRVAAANDNMRGSLANVSAQFQDVAVTAAMGMNPIMIALQQGTQLSAVLMTMQSPLRGLLSAFVSIINPVSLLTIGFIALGAAAIQWFTGARSEADTASEALEAHAQWLDKVLDGYDLIRQAAKIAFEDVGRTPQEAVVMQVGADQELQAKKLQETLEQIDALQAGLRTDLAQMNLSKTLFADAIAINEQLLAMKVNAESTQQEWNDWVTELTRIETSLPDDFIAGEGQAATIRGIIAEMVRLKDAADAVRSAQEANVVVLAQMGAGGSKLDNVAAAARDLEGKEQDLHRALRDAEAALRAQLDAALQAASGYGAAAGAANVYAGALQRLNALIPAVAAQQAAQNNLAGATIAYADGMEALDGLVMSRDAYLAQEAALKSAFDRAKAEVTGLADVTSELESAERQAYIDSLPAKQAAIERLNDAHVARVDAINASVAAGADEAAAQNEIARSAAVLEQSIANTNAQFAAMEAKSGGAAKALKDAEKDFESFIGTADKLAEALFPGEYARREAAELMALLDQYRDKLDNFQIAGVEQKIADLNIAADLGLRSLEDRADEAAEALLETLGSALSSLFDGPMDDMDAFFDKLIGGFANLGQANLDSVFKNLFSTDGMTGATGGAEGGTSFWDQIGGILGQNVKQGAADGTQQGAMQGLKGLAGLAGAGVGGFGIGAQTQSPLMGALGGALAGMSAGPIGAVVGGIAGFIGGLFGMNQALQDNKKKLDENRAAIEQFISTALGDSVSQYTKMLEDARSKAQSMIELARAAQDWDLAGRIQAALDQLPATLAREFTKDLQSSLNELEGNSWLNDVAAAQKQYNDNLADAATLGVDASMALRVFELTLKKIATEGDLTTEQMAEFAAMFPDIAAGLDAVTSIDIGQLEANVDRARSALSAAYQKERSALEAVVSTWKQVSAQMRDFRNGLRLDTALSPLSPFDKFSEAQRQFNEVSAKALAGDQQAMGDLTNVSQEYLDAARGYYASSEQYFAIFESVEAILDQALSKADTQVSAAEQQIALLDRQVAGLIDINESVLSVAEAIRQLQAANDNLAGANGFDASTYWSQDLKGLYAQTKDYKADTGASSIPIAGFWNELFSATSAGMMDEIARKLADQVAALPRYADGTMFHPGGPAWVGERGPELLNLPRGAQVMSNPMSMAFAANSNGSNDNGALLAEMRALRSEVVALRQAHGRGTEAIVGTTDGVRAAVERGNSQKKLANGSK